MLTPCRSKVTFVFGTWSLAEARSWPSFIFRLPAKAKSQSFKFVNVDPLQKQGHICFWHLIPCRSKVLAILYFSTPCRSKVAFVLGAWSPAEARSWPFFIFLTPCESKVTTILYFSILCRSKISSFFQHMMIPEQNQCFYLYLIFTLIIWIFLKFSYYHVKLK